MKRRKRDPFKKPAMDDFLTSGKSDDRKKPPDTDGKDFHPKVTHTAKAKTSDDQDRSSNPGTTQQNYQRTSKGGQPNRSGRQKPFGKTYSKSSQSERHSGQTILTEDNTTEHALSWSKSTPNLSLRKSPRSPSNHFINKSIEPDFSWRNSNQNLSRRPSSSHSEELRRGNENHRRKHFRKEHHRKHTIGNTPSDDIGTGSAGPLCEKDNNALSRSEVLTEKRVTSSKAKPVCIDGCRPKSTSHLQRRRPDCNERNLKVDKRSYKDYGGREGGEQKDENKSESGANFGFPYLTQLKTKEPAHVAMALTKSTDKLKVTLRRTEAEKDLLELLMEVLMIAFASSSIPLILEMLFDMLTDCKWFDTVAFYFLDLVSGIDDKPTTQQVKKAKIAMACMLKIMWNYVNRPTHLGVFNRVLTTMGQIIPYLEQSSEENALVDHYLEFTELKKRAEKAFKQQSSRTTRQLPPDDFRELQTLPHSDEVKGIIKPFLQKNRIDGEYDDEDHYLDTQYRLLREDMIGPLREGIMEYRTIVSSKSPEIRRQRGELKIYNSVRVVTFNVGTNGFCYKLQVDLPNRGRRIDWKVSKRLIYGSLVCLSTDDFETMEFAIVINRDDMAAGILEVQFCNTELSTVNLLGREFKMTESPAYYEAYKHVLKSLQLIGPDEFPFTNYIVNCDVDVKHPSYMREQSCDLRPLVDKTSHLGRNSFSKASKRAQNINVLSPTDWPTASELHMDESQLLAVQHALSREFAIIQGPPGTGKTYVGLKIMKVLLHNKLALSKLENDDSLRQKPMLVVCYTNHALDQFLEGITKFFKGKIVRVGGRFNESMEKFALKKLRREKSYVTRQLKDRIIAEIRQKTLAIDDLCMRSELYQSVVLSETCLRKVMNDIHYNSLYNSNEEHYFGRSVACTWLGLDNVDTRKSPNQTDDNMENDTDFVEIDTGNRELLEEALPFLKLDEDRRQAVFAQIKRNIQDPYFQNLKNHETEIQARINDIQVQLNALQNHTRRRTFRRFQKTEDELRNDLSAFETECKHRKYIRKEFEAYAKRVIRGRDIMLEENADKIRDVWKLNLDQRRRLYRLWVHKLVLQVLDGIDELKSEFVVLAKRYKEVALHEDRLIMEEADVVGMTTTCAARYQSVLKEIQPEIIIIEEAAEVLESHIVTSLNHRCKHLVLIGDHKQLRPNPAVYKLAKKYNMDVSLFERMIRNDIPYSCLQLQHRMRPEIANIMRFIYPQLVDHPDVKEFDDIRGVKGNLLFVNHKTHESRNEGMKSYSNVFEAQFAAKLCMYLLMQGYSESQITILTTYTGQLREIQNSMPRGQFGMVRVTVVDNYQGEENDIIILSLVRSNTDSKIGFLKTENRICVALSRAKKGFYVLGNFDHLAENSQLWMKIKMYAKENSYMSTKIGMYCQNHPSDAGFDAARVEDFLKSPEGGCLKKCEFRLDCGHVCKRYCHVLDSSHATYKCQDKCTLSCERGHLCKARCYMKPCPPCKKKIPKQIPRCGHTQSVPCYIKPEEWVCDVKPCPNTLKCGHPCAERCGDPHTTQCVEIIEHTWKCGHTASIKCWQKEIKKCPIQCDFVLKCGHVCSGTCGSCFQGRFHDQCTHKCARILICGHICKDSCRNCSPCMKPCENRCTHSKCPKTCGEPCKPCNEPCPWRCEHFKCTKRCSEPCDRPACNRPCKKTIRCGHRCIGLCGEPCPDKCRKCDKDEVTTILFGNEDDKNARFIQLEDCRHIIESKALDKYMKQSNDSDNIGLKGCPLCKTVIRKSVRYGQQINETLKDIEQVKKSIIGDAENGFALRKELSAEYAGIKHYFVHSHLFEDDLTEQGRRGVGNTGPTVYENVLKTIKCQFDLVKEVVKVKKTIFRNKPSKSDTNLEDWLKKVIEKIAKRRTFISEQEISDVRAECYRAKIFLEYIKMKDKLAFIELSKRAEVRSDLDKLHDEVAAEEPMADKKVCRIKDILKRLKENMKYEGLGIDDDERIQIINAVGLKQGHWFKCPNGHVYAIGECGGANQRGVCPECKAEIGGQSHRLAEGNRLAAEMDGARYAAYSEEANNLMNFDLNNIH